MLNSTRIVPKSWSSTLQLPKSAFPARALLADRPKYLRRCTDDLYAWQRERPGERKRFTLHDGPPYANGVLHIGHALNKILKDITCRFQLSLGKTVDYVPGWDCHGLPIELKALEKQTKQGFQYVVSKQRNAVAIRKAARELAILAVKDQKKSFRDWGIMADWDNSWTTFRKEFQISQLHIFKEMVKKGLIYRRFKPVYWSPSSRTALAEAELEYKEDHVSTAAFVKYPLQSISRALRFGDCKVSAVVWTTTPWTLPANKAIGIHSDLNYAVVESMTHGLLLLAKSRLAEVEAICKESFKVVAIVQGSALAGAIYRDTVFVEKSQVRFLLHADFVSAESGSGLVHLAPGHGVEDYEICLRHGITAFAPLDDAGCFTTGALREHPEILRGKPVLTEGNRSVLEYLRSHGRILGEHAYTHRYPYDWRSKQPVILRATEQWFADVGKIREAALISLESVQFVPEGGEERLRSFVKNRSEWCISRQRAWGVPLPALYNKKTGEAVLNEESVTHIISVFKDRGIDAWWTDDESDPRWVPPGLEDNFLESSYRRGTDTMDVWFDSGTSWTQTKNISGHGEDHVADVYLEGTDQHRGWFQSSLLTHIAYQDISSAAVAPKAPFKTLITHGFTLDEKGRKMSKSIGNVISPDEIMQGTLLPPIKKRKKDKTTTEADDFMQGTLSPPVKRNKKDKATIVADDTAVSYDAMGSDALRLWAATCDYTKDVIISQTVLKAINASLAKYRVTFKLLLGVLEDFFPSSEIHHMEIINKIALIQLNKVRAGVWQHYEKFEYNKAIIDINKYIATDLSGLYVEAIKDIVYANNKGSASRNQAQYTLFRIFCQLQAMLAPVTPLLVEEAWDYAPTQIQHLQRTLLTIHCHAETGHNGWYDKQLELDLPYLMQANAAVKKAQESARSEKKMGSSLQSDVMFQCEESTDERESSALNLLTRYRGDLEKLFVVSNLDLCTSPIPAYVNLAEWAYKADFDIDGSKVVAHVYSPQKAKCVRCWKYTAPVEAKEQEALCRRCENVVEGLRQSKPELFEASLDAQMAAAAAWLHRKTNSNTV
jgi:isoleucyl-tRNA synthetase